MSQRDALLKLLQLTSSSLPVGAFAYSQGLEYAVEAGWVRSVDDAREWIGGLLWNVQCRQDLPLFARLYRAWAEESPDQAADWDARLMAARETAELRAEERTMGAALARLLAELDVPVARHARDFGYTAMFALAAAHWRLPLGEAACGYAWSWCQNQVAAAIKIIPLGQTSGQQLLAELAAGIPGVVETALALTDDGIGCTAPGLAIASAQHETQYTRLFLS